MSLPYDIAAACWGFLARNLGDLPLYLLLGAAGLWVMRLLWEVAFSRMERRQ